MLAASVLSADFAALGAASREALGAGASLLHVDIMDGHFVPNLSMGPAICAALRRACPDAFLDVHLMVTDPRKFLEPFVKAGANSISFHVEAEKNPRELAAAARKLGVSVGLASNPETPTSAIEPYLKDFDLHLVMSVHPGFSGQGFIEDSLKKTAWIRERVGAKARIEMDGGVDSANGSRCVAAGADVLVSASALFGRGAIAPAAKALLDSFSTAGRVD
ncbi:MAG: ribulose-phosphate 3-epimerase [Planctomycetes bacterium]|nr:ribulose-phosphate 3-epimerase [Planctomycetota bacterium]